MTASVLVAYATHAGSTREVAEVIATVLGENKIEIELLPASKVKKLDGFQAVVLGAPLYMFHWHGDALGFLSRHREALLKLPAAVFALGPFHDVEKELTEAREQLDKELAKVPWLKPVSIQVFAGVYDPKKLHFPYSLLNYMPANPMRQIPASDERNWPQIRAWAAGLPDLLKTPAA